MALTTDYRKIKNFKTRCYKKYAGQFYTHPITQCLALSTVYIGLNEITDKNIGEFWRRIDAWQRGFGPMCDVADGRTKSGWRTRMLTYQDIRNHIGLETNAAPKTKAYFNRRFMELLRREAEYATL